MFYWMWMLTKSGHVRRYIENMGFNILHISTHFEKEAGLEKDKGDKGCSSSEYEDNSNKKGLRENKVLRLMKYYITEKCLFSTKWHSNKIEMSLGWIHMSELVV